MTIPQLTYAEINLLLHAYAEEQKDKKRQYDKAKRKSMRGRR